MKAAIFQCAGGGLTPTQRLQRLALQIETADLDLVVCPELFATGYNIANQMAGLAEQRRGAFAERIAALARHAGTAIIYGYPEASDGVLYNAAACIGPDGLIAHHRKRVLPPGFETELFAAGNDDCIFQLGAFRCGILICYEAEFPEAPRALALAGVDVLIVPTALSAEWPNVAEKMMPTRAFENGCWLLYSNHAGEENGLVYFGGSRIIGPDGIERAVAGKEEKLLSATLDLKPVRVVRNRLPYLKDRTTMVPKIQ